MALNKNTMGQDIYDSTGLEALIDSITDLTEQQKIDAKADQLEAMVKLSDGIITSMNDDAKAIINSAITLEQDKITRTVRVLDSETGEAPSYIDEEITYVTDVRLVIDNNATSIS